MEQKIQQTYLILIALTISFLAVGYLTYQNYQLKKSNLELQNEIFTIRGQLLLTKMDFASTTKSLNSYISALSQNLFKTEAERNDFEQKYADEKSRMDIFASQMSSIENKVGSLEKLSKTDPQLLQKYSKVYFLNENYTPETLIKISPEYTFDSAKDYLFYSKTWPFLQDMLIASAKDNIDIKIISAYRSFGTQSELKSMYKIIYGSGANQFSADQGYSEHQLGTTIDITTLQIGTSYLGFEKTATYQWLKNNSHKYGFILSYPKDNQYYQFEPWHWRFIGKSLALQLRQEGVNFYDISQREINQYLISFFD